MILNSGTKNRLVIYFFYDKDGIADRYVLYMLRALREHSSRILVVSNSELNQESLQNLREASGSGILIRENKGFDVWAYKEALEYCGWENLTSYDEVVLMNYTLFGPLYPFEEMFGKMDVMDLDFWGITKHHEVGHDVFGTCRYGYIPEHIQSSFLVIRRSLMASEQYRAFWENMPMINSYADSVGLYEAIFTKDFNDKGFRSAAYIDTSDLEGYTRFPLMMMADELIINRRCPVMKVRSFSQNYYDILGETIGNCTSDAFEYIKNSLDYDTDMMIEHVVRTENMADLKRIMHLNYVLPRSSVFNKPKTPASKIALMMHLYFPDLAEKSLRYAQSMPKGSDLYITVPDEDMEKEVTEQLEKIKHFGKTKVIVIENRGRDVSSLLVGCAPYVSDYELVCFMHDKKTKQIKPYCQGEAFSYKCFENCLSSKEYVENVIYTFESNRLLGMLMPPHPNHGPWWDTLGREWYSNYENTEELAKKLELKCRISRDSEPVSPLGTMFWFRPQAMKKLFDYGWKYEDFPKEPNKMDGTILHAVERVYGYVVQDSGYYCAWAMTDRFTSMELTNLYYMIRLAHIAAAPPEIALHRKIIKLIAKVFIPKSVWEKMRIKYTNNGGTKWIG